jgi:trimethylamine---corrinoid protein Co-methyltransferase
MTEASRRTGGRRNRGQPRERIVQASPAYVTREIPFYAMLDEEVLVKIENQVARIIQEIGLEFREDEVALQLWREAGADVQGTRVRAPRGMVRALCQTAPNEFEQVARNLERSVRMGGRHQVFAPV